jgi:hypothetical protein
MNLNKRSKLFSIVVMPAAAFSMLLLGAGIAHAQTASVSAPVHRGIWHKLGGGEGMVGRGTFGTVAAVAGDTLTVTSRVGKNGTTTTYTVDATNATVIKNGSSSSVSAIGVGDTIMVSGTVSGTSITATLIRDGMPQGGLKMRTPAQSPLKGNGEPVIGGAVTAINGTTLTVTNKSNVTYMVDASAATIVKDNATSSLSTINTGDNVIVQGAVNGTSVTASSVDDQGGAAPSMSTSTPQNGSAGPHKGIFGAIGGFFSHLFGF